MPSGKSKPQKEEDLYEKALKLREEKLIAKDAKRKAALESRVPKPQTQEDGDGDKRAITYNISKNRGLTPHKRKELRNPRVKHRKKYEKALKSRKGQVRQYNASLQDKPYSGEANGINPYVIKSTPLQ